MPALMILGTASDVGKSVTTAALCRIFRNDGVDVAPFKAQNMALNSFATRDGLEIGRAQAAQAQAARLEPTAEMNPILLKPGGDTFSQVILNGRIFGLLTAAEYYARHAEFFDEAKRAYNNLAARHELIVLEGAGSPVEMNLKHLDMVNLPMAQHADAKCVLVADIDRGGVFAQVIGTYALLEPVEKARFCGFMINRFRGDPRLLGDAVPYLEQRVGQRCLGVVPYLRDLGIDEEDSVRVRTPAADGGLRVGAVLLRSISNFTDFDALLRVDGVSFSWIRNAAQIPDLDVVILPGSKNTVRDLEDMRARGIADAVTAHERAGKTVMGICGGFQMLGRTIDDPSDVEGGARHVPGLSLIDVVTTMHDAKTVRQVRGSFANRAHFGDAGVCGYEIHVGETQRGDAMPLFVLTRVGSGEVVDDGAIRPDGRVLGTYVHGVFDERECALALINHLRALNGFDALDTSAIAVREDPYEHVATHFRAHLDLQTIYHSLGLRIPA